MPSPPFNTGLGGFQLTEQTKPPVRFEGVTTRVFPLKANMYRLSAFCDDFLNLAPDIVRFRPSLPYVYLMVIDYGKMAAEVENLGWVAQHEIAFAVPLEWYRREGDGWTFVDWASICPFIFVDNEMSLSTGREVFGWPKVRAFLDPESGPWISDPTASQPLLCVSTMLFPELYAGQRQEPEVFLRVRQRPAPWTVRTPPDLINGFEPLYGAARAVGGWMNLLGQFMEVATGLPLRGYAPGAGPLGWLNLLRRGPQYLNALAAPPALNNITLKQFRDSGDPSFICYQAIVNSVMRIKRFNGGGMVGDTNLLLGDPSGGIDILVRRSPAQPIIEALGIEVGRAGELAERGMAQLRPVLPFWLDFDLEYAADAEALCWRTRSSPWCVGPSVAETSSATDGSGTDAAPPVEPDGHRFISAPGLGAEDITGPFDFPNTTLRVLPLLADRTKLEALCEQYLGVTGLGPDCPYRFKVWGHYVYLVVTSFGEMSSETNDIGWWAERELTFFFPVQVWDRDEPNLLSVALVPAFTFADTEAAAVVGREIHGRPTATAVFTSPPDTWMADSGPAGMNQELVTLKTLLLPALNLGQQAETRLLLEVTQRDPLPYNDDIGWGVILSDWVSDLKREVARKQEHRNSGAFAHLRDLAVALFAGSHSFNILTLKQFRDVSDPNAACYQALVRCARTVEHVYDVREIEDGLHVRLHRNPALAVADLLGLKTKYTETSRAGVVDILQPIRPFWVRLALREHLGEDLCWRTQGEWQCDEKHRRGDRFFFAAGQTGVAAGLGQRADSSRQHLDRVFAEMQAPPLSREQATEAVCKAEPQLVIESMLSMEWENWGNPRWYQKAQRWDFSKLGQDLENLLESELGKGWAKKLEKGTLPKDKELKLEKMLDAVFKNRDEAVKPYFCIPCHTIGERETRMSAFGTDAAGDWWWVDDAGAAQLWRWR